MPVMRKKKNKTGMTLVELLITLTILSVISLAVYASLNSGLKIWKRVNQPMAHEDLDIFFDRFGHDLRNCARFTGISFTGTEERVEFPTILPSPRLGGDVIGRVSYAYDPQAKALTRVQQDFSQIHSGEESSKTQSIPDLGLVKFRYYVYDKETKEYSWREDFLEGDFPSAVRIELELGDGPQAQSFTRTVSIPISS